MATDVQASEGESPQVKKLSQLPTDTATQKTIEEQNWRAVVTRYAPAIRQFLRDLLKYQYRLPDSENLADELCQECVEKLLEGKFNAERALARGFRKYLKTALRNQVMDAFGRRNLNPELILIEQLADDRSDTRFDFEWRDLMLKNAWEEFERRQREEWRAPYYDVLRVAAKWLQESGRRPTVAELTHAVNERLSPSSPFTEVQVDKHLRRAAKKFAEILIKEAANSLRTSERSAIEELKQLKLDYLLAPLDEPEPPAGDDEALPDVPPEAA